jgi:hypothetical protein
MSDVVRRADTDNNVKNGNVVTTASPKFPVYDTQEPEYYQNPPVSGVGDVTSTRWDNRFDDTTYYTA